MDWQYYHSKLGMGKINPVERPVLPNNPPATNEPRKERIITNPQAPVTSSAHESNKYIKKEGDNWVIVQKGTGKVLSRHDSQEKAEAAFRAMEMHKHEGSVLDMTVGEMIRMAEQAKTDETTGIAVPEVATPDKNVTLTDIGAVDEGSNEAASKADAQEDTLRIGESKTHNVAADEHESLPAAGPEDAGYNTDITTDNSGPTKTWDKEYGGDSNVLKQREPVSSEPFPSREDANFSKGKNDVPRTSAIDPRLATGEAQHPWPEHSTLGYDSDAFPHEDDGGSGEERNKASQGAQPADPVGTSSMKSFERVNLLEPVTSPENNSGPTKTWHGTDEYGYAVTRQQDPVTSEPWPPANEGVQPRNSEVPRTSSQFTSHILKAMKLADTEIDLGLAQKQDKYNRLAELGNQSEEVIDAQLNALSKVKTAGLRKPSAIAKSATRLPSFKLTQQSSLGEPEAIQPIPDEALFF